MVKQKHDNGLTSLTEKNKYALVLISCTVPAIYFIAVFLFLQHYIPALGCLLTFALFLLINYKPLLNREYSTVFSGVLSYAFIFEFFAAYYLEWEMGFQNLLFALIPLSFSFIYLDNNYDQMLSQGIKYSIFTVVCYLICSLVDFIVAPVSGATHLHIRIISGITSIITIGMIFSYAILFILDLHDAHQKLVAQTNARLDGMRSSMMLSQIKPHFLYNTMGAIEEMIDSDPARAKKELRGFAQYMRMNIDSLSSSELVPFDKELSHIRSYIQIQNLRFGDIITINYDVKNTLFKLPPLTVQPLVENAVKHGLMPKGGKGTIRVSEWEDESSYYISVADDGVGFDHSKQKSVQGSTGLSNINYRLETLCGGRTEIISSPGCGSIATVIVPKKLKE